jgi:hypothetical protein
MHGFFLVLLIIVTGCNRADPYPERRDPVLADIEADLRLAERAVMTLEKEKTANKAQMEAARLQTGEAKTKWTAYHETEKNLDQAQQHVKYLKLRKETRIEQDRKSYRDALASGSPWPDPQEFKDYMTNKRLKTAPRDWNERLRQLLGEKKPKE